MYNPYYNHTVDELLRQASDDDNLVALALAEKMRAEVDACVEAELDRRYEEGQAEAQVAYRAGDFVYSILTGEYNMAWREVKKRTVYSMLDMSYHYENHDIKLRKVSPGQWQIEVFNGPSGAYNYIERFKTNAKGAKEAEYAQYQAIKLLARAALDKVIDIIIP